MNKHGFLFLAQAAVICSALGVFQIARATPADAVAAGKLMSFSHAAEVLESQCQSELASTRWSGTFAAWRKRNHDLVQVIHAYGNRVKWYPGNVADPARWQDLQKQQRAAVASQLATALASAKAERCKGFAEAYEKGEFDLRNFPADLQAIEAYER